jgi:hypothetical protein
LEGSLVRLDAQLHPSQVEGPPVEGACHCLASTWDEDISLFICEDRMRCEIKCKGIKRLNDVDTLHEYHREKVKVSFPEYHPQVIAFQQVFLQVLKIFKVDSMYSKATINLPFPVQIIIASPRVATRQRLFYSSKTTKPKRCA